MSPQCLCFSMVLHPPLASCPHHYGQPPVQPHFWRQSQHWVKEIRIEQSISNYGARGLYRGTYKQLNATLYNPMSKLYDLLLYSTQCWKSSLHMYFQKWNCTVWFPIPTFMFLSGIYIFPGSVCLFGCRKIGRQSWEYIYKSLTDTWIRKLGDRTL